MLKNALFFALVGYLLGSILFAPIFGKLLKGKNILEESRDKNPGTANAFMYGGFLCGVLTLCGDLFKGFLPVFLYMRQPAGFDEAGLALVLAAPVVGHIFPLFSNFKGGKGIATSFGCLLGLVPELAPVLILAVTFIFFSVVLKVNPHYYRTILTYIVSMVLMIRFCRVKAIVEGFGLIVAAVMVRMFTSQEEKGKLTVKLLWRS